MAGITVYQRKSDGYINATAMCKAAGKMIGHWSTNIDTKKVIASLEGSIGNPIHPLVDTIVTGPNAGRGTWVHPKVALHLANWCSPEFYAAVLDWTVDEWDAGNTMGKPKIDFSDPVTVCKLYLEAEEGRRRSLELITTVTAE